MNAQGSTASSNIDQAGDEIGQFGDQSREFIDDQHEPGHRIGSGVGGSGVIVDVFGPRASQLAFAAA